MRFDVLTIFPGFFSGPLQHGILSRAIVSGRLAVHAHDLRGFTHDRHRTVDDRPFGGGEGMVLKPGPIFDCADSLNVIEKTKRDTTKQSVILLSAQGRPFNQAVARELSSFEQVLLICGRYEGVDERVSEHLADRELSIGDYILSGGELAALVIVDAVARLLPGVLGHADSARFESFGQHDDPEDTMTANGVPRSTHGSGGLLDYPHYTRPASFRGVEIPEVLASGDHVAIRRWRRHQSLAKTLRNRPDLLDRAQLTAEERAFLDAIGD